MEASYGKEPFDLRLLLLRLGRNLWKILALTILGTVLFGGGYYVKNVLLQPDPGYAASSTYKVEYVENPNAAGAYYINEATWNSLLHTGEFLDGVETHLQEAAERGETGAAAVLEQGRDRWIEALSAALPSDFSIPVTKATTQDPGESIALAHAAGRDHVRGVRREYAGDHADQSAGSWRPRRGSGAGCASGTGRDPGGGAVLVFRSGDLPVMGAVPGQRLAPGHSPQTVWITQSGYSGKYGICGKCEISARENKCS